jgi:hypothetical protein
VLPGLNTTGIGLPGIGGAGATYVHVATMDPCAASVGPLGTVDQATFWKVAVLPTTCAWAICWPELESATVTDCGCVPPLPWQVTVKASMPTGAAAWTLLILMVYGMSTVEPRLTCSRSSSRHTGCEVRRGHTLQTSSPYHAQQATSV